MPVALAVETDQGQQFLDPLLRRGGILAEQRRGGTAPAGKGEIEIVADGEFLEHRRLLELAPDAELGDRRLVEPGEVDAAVEIDLAGVRLGLAGDDVHHRGLAGAVRADDRAHLAGLDHQRQLVQRLEAVEGHRDAVEVEQRVLGPVVHRPYSAADGLSSPPGGPSVSVGEMPSSARPRLRRWPIADQPSAMVPTMPLGRNRVTAMNRPPSANSQ